MPLTIFRRGKVWHYRGTVAGRRLRGSTRTKSKEVAQRIAAAIEARHWKGHLDGPAAVLTFAQASMIYRRAGKADRFLKLVEDHWKDALVKDITAGIIRAAAPVLYPKAGPASWNRQVIVPTQAVINFAAERELCPRLTVKRFKIVRKERTPATWPWVQAFMAHATVPRVAALAGFMFFTAARVSEALAVEWEQVDLTKRTVLIRMGKLGGDERTAHLPPELFEALANLPSERKGKVFGFASYQNCKTQWRTAVRRAGIKPLTFHSCRHGFATTLLHNGVDVLTVAELGGWKTPALVLSTYGHAQKNPTLTDLLTGTPIATNRKREAS